MIAYKIRLLMSASTSFGLLLLLLYKYLYLYIVVVVGPVEMWKTHFIVVTKGIVFHSPCGYRCGKILSPVENSQVNKVFHISTAPFFTGPVEMWKTRN